MPGETTIELLVIPDGCQVTLGTPFATRVYPPVEQGVFDDIVNRGRFIFTSAVKARLGCGGVEMGGIANNV